MAGKFVKLVEETVSEQHEKLVELSEEVKHRFPTVKQSFAKLSSPYPGWGAETLQLSLGDQIVIKVHLHYKGEDADHVFLLEPVKEEMITAYKQHYFDTKLNKLQKKRLTLNDIASMGAHTKDEIVEQLSFLLANYK
jgi:hypothetical protein